MDRELLEFFHIPHRILPEIVESGTAKGTLSPEVQQRLGLPAIRVTAVCGHDTQCAAFAAPAKTDKHVFLSCGTWSLVRNRAGTAGSDGAGGGTGLVQ